MTPGRFMLVAGVLLALVLASGILLRPQEPPSLGPPPSSLSDITSGGTILNYVAQPSPIVNKRGQVIADVQKERYEFTDRTRVLPDSKSAALAYWSGA